MHSPVNHELTSLADRTGTVLLLAFASLILIFLFPLKPDSPDWGIGVSKLIANSGSLALVGLALKSYSNLAGKQKAQLDESTEESSLIVINNKQRRIRKFSQVIFSGFLLISIWQFFIFFGALDQIDTQGLESSYKLDQSIRVAEKSLKEAQAQAIAQAWNQANQGTSTFISKPVTDTEGQRNYLLNRLKAEAKASQEAQSQQAIRAKWNLSKDSLSITLLTLIYAWGFRGIAKY
jgi:hypothetical protein